MSASAEIGRLVSEATELLKRDAKGAVQKLTAAYALALAEGSADERAIVAEELSRGFARRKSAARSMHFARKATRHAPDRRAAWATLAKTCELVATRTDEKRKPLRARALFRGAAQAFKKAASLATDPEDRRWLEELARDAARQADPKPAKRRDGAPQG